MNEKLPNKKNIIVLVSVSIVLVLILVIGSIIYNSNDKGTDNGINVVNDNLQSTNEPETEPEHTENAPENIEYAPDFTVYDYDGNQVKLSDNFGKPIVFNFWATWCGPCKSEMPGFENLYKKYRDKVVFMMINSSDSRETVLEFMNDNGYTFPIYYDDSQIAAYTYGVSAIPATFVTDKYGQIYGYQIGVLSEEVLKEAIKTVLGE